MDAYFWRVGLGAAINLALLIPFFALAWLTGSRPKPRPVALFALLFVFDMALVFAFMLAKLIPSWGGWNWQGKVLEMAWPVLLTALVAAYPAARIGLQLRAAPGSWRLLLILCPIYAVAIFSFMFAMGGRFGISGDLPTFAYEATMPGLAEEFVYRGVLLMLLNEAFGRPWKLAGAQIGWGFVIVSVMFGLLHGIDAKGPGAMHIYWTGMIFPLLIGLVLGWLRERTGSVWPGVVFHNFVNVLNHFMVGI